MTKRNDYHRDGPSAEDRALERFTELMIEKISTLQKDWSKPWFTAGMMKWPKNLSGREYNGMNALMLALECEKRGYELPVFCTFDAALSLNYSKKKDGSRQPCWMKTERSCRWCPCRKARDPSRFLSPPLPWWTRKRKRKSSMRTIKGCPMKKNSDIRFIRR